jgi:bifunctional DNA-binding transcriptional regulator/antitoxin component of YhaV-PrlF toxin-antitoxin module
MLIMDREYEATMDSEGHFDFPPEIRERYGWKNGAKVKIEVRSSEVAIKSVKNESERHQIAMQAIDDAVGMLGTDGSLVRMLMEERRAEKERDDHAFGAR